MAVVVPIVKTAFNDNNITTHPTSTLENTILGSNYISIILNLVFMAFWTFGLSIWINLLILLPVRVVMLASAWYIISPAK